MMKKILIVGLCAMFLTTAVLAASESVFVTKNGKKYHKADCVLIQNKGAQEISLEAALQKNLEPCKKCFGEKAISSKAEKKIK